MFLNHFSFWWLRLSSFVGFGDFGLSFILGHSLSEDSRSKMAQSQRVARNRNIPYQVLVRYHTYRLFKFLLFSFPFCVLSYFQITARLYRKTSQSVVSSLPFFHSFHYFSSILKTASDVFRVHPPMNRLEVYGSSGPFSRRS